jgi:D-alanyl-lipoteichoic acid acyltransferase DltB (MBOAT superfamily)
MLDWLWRHLVAPWTDAPWPDWRDFWLKVVLDDRFFVCYFLPLLPLLLLFPRRYLRHGIVLTGCAFLGWVFGVFHLGAWLLTCIVFYYFGERFLRESRRTDVIRWGPPLAACIVVGGWYLATQALQHLRLPGGLDTWLLAHAPWLFPLGLRGYSWEPQFPWDGPVTLFGGALFSAHLVGTAYLTIRMLHYLSELRRETIPAERRALLNFLAYTCYAPNLMQGPIERYLPFQDEMDTCHERRSLRSFAPGLVRIAWGVWKCLFATLVFHPVLWYQLGIGNDKRYYRAPETIESYPLLYFGVFLQIYALYLEFSGYCDVSAGIARWLGYRQVENFNWPWLATSVRDFWRRWHISLSMILRDYVYIPLGGNRRHATLNLCVTFALIGLWHAPILQVAIWGVIMGLMIAINHRWSRWTKRLDELAISGAAASGGGDPPPLDGERWGARAATFARRILLKCQPLPRVCAWLITQHAFVFSLLVFFGGSGAIRVLRELIRRPIVWIFGL